MVAKLGQTKPGRRARAAVICSALIYLGVATGAFLNAVERSRWTFNAQLIHAASVILIAIPLAAHFDVLGANIGAALATLPFVVAHIYYINKLSDNEPVADRLPEIESTPASNKPTEAFAA